MIKKINVENLFGAFTYNIDPWIIPYNRNIPFVFIHGVNGSGKTIIMKMIQSVLTGDNEYLASVPFHSFSVTLDNDFTVCVVNSESGLEYSSGFNGNMVPGNTDVMRRMLSETRPLYKDCLEMVSDETLENYSSLIREYAYREEYKERLQIFKKYLEEAFDYDYKKFDLGGNGISVILPDGSLMPLKYLSYGERSLISIFFETIFMTGKNGVFLLDSPETSLHVFWQRNLFHRLSKICAKNNVQMIIATHSPDIIGAHINLMVCLDDDTECE